MRELYAPTRQSRFSLWGCTSCVVVVTECIVGLYIYIGAIGPLILVVYIRTSLVVVTGFHPSCTLKQKYFWSHRNVSDIMPVPTQNMSSIHYAIDKADVHYQKCL